jgi:MFS-type transporter involved in bile tolerance (Atg22 family)
MNLMLTVMLACVVLGLLARRFGAREQLGVVFIAVMMTALYHFFSWRFV